jgi:hypothetical protein
MGWPPVVLLHLGGEVSLAPRYDRFRADRTDGFLLALPNNGIGEGATHPAQLDKAGADTTGGSRDQHAFAGSDSGPIKHVLARQIGAAEGGELDIRHRGVHHMRLVGGNREVFGIAAVAAVTDVIDVGEAVVVTIIDAEIDHDALADALARDARPHSDDSTNSVRSLNSRKGHRRRGAAAAPGRDGIRILLGPVCSFAHPDIGVVHAAG